MNGTPVNRRCRVAADASLPAVILSGGSEIVSVSLAEALLPHGVPLMVIGLGRPSILRDVHPCVLQHRRLRWPPVSVAAALDELVTILHELGAGRGEPWPVFATEDGGLRLLLEGRARLAALLALPAAASLPMGGLDKAETIESLSAEGLADVLAPSMVLESVEQLPEALARLGADAVFKPALKPLSMNLAGMASKVVTAELGEGEESLRRRLVRAWALSDRWIAQRRLLPAAGETVWWGVRSKHGRLYGTTARERWKYPRMGGSGCWVETEPIKELHEHARRILSALDFRGLVELEFLQDDQGRWRLIEVNPRAWLQVGLPTRAGLPLPWLAYRDLAGAALPEPGEMTREASWVNVERMLAAALSGEYGGRLAAVVRLLGVVWRSECRVVYDTPLRRIRARWIRRVIAGAWRVGWSARADRGKATSRWSC